MNPLRSLSPTLYAIAAVLLLALLTLGYCQMTQGARDAARQAKNDTTMAQGRTTSAVEAINEIGELGQRADATDTEVKEAQDALRQADPADRDRVFRHRVCIMQQRPDCDRLFGTGAAAAEHPDAPR